jgi:Domain of unknown function (DUF4234)
MSDDAYGAPGGPAQGAPTAPGGWQQPTAIGSGSAPLPKRRNVLGVWLGLPLITLGIYSLVWWYKINKETRFNPRTKVSPGLALLAVTLGCFLLIPPFVSIYKTGQRIADAQRAAGVGSSCNGVIGIALMFVFGLYPLYYQAEMNKIPDSYPGASTGDRVPLRAA